MKEMKKMSIILILIFVILGALVIYNSLVKGYYTPTALIINKMGAYLLLLLFIVFNIFLNKPSKIKNAKAKGETESHSIQENSENNYDQSMSTVWIYKIQSLEKMGEIKYSYHINNGYRGNTEDSIVSLAKTMKIYALEVMEKNGGEFKYIFSPPCDFIHSYPRLLTFSAILPLSEDEKNLFQSTYLSYTAEKYIAESPKN